MNSFDDEFELWPYVLASFLLHALILALLPRAVATLEFKEEPIEVFAVAEPPTKEGGWRIADIPKPEVQQRPEEAKLLGLYDSAVREESVGPGLPPRSAGGKRGALKERPRGQRALDDRPRARADKLLAFDRTIFDEGRAARDEGGNAAESGSLDDFFPDFKRGAHTYLNVLRYPDVEYFVRLKRAFRIAFNPEPSLRDHFLRNQVARGSIDVVLGVSVRTDGEIAELFVFRTSGIASYDGEALRTVRASAPFARPPEKFLSDDGLLRMSWTFSVYL